MKKPFKYQGWHLLAAIIAIGLMFYVTTLEDYFKGEFWGLSTTTWLLIAIAIPVIHQIYVVMVWRLELHYQLVSKKFGEKGLIYFGGFFMLFLAARPLSLTLLAFADRESFDISWPWRWALTILLGIPVIYLGISVKKYFGIRRALGEDHFKPEYYRENPMIKGGIFKYTNNGMYIYGFLGLYLPGILLASRIALAAAVFQCLYIWVHYFFTEKPDMDIIYGDKL